MQAAGLRCRKARQEGAGVGNLTMLGSWSTSSVGRLERRSHPLSPSHTLNAQCLDATPGRQAALPLPTLLACAAGC